VTFYVDGLPIGPEVGAAPYSIVWDTTTVSPGSHTLTAIARDLAGNTKTSAPVSVTVAMTTPSNIGQFSALIPWPIVAVNAALLPTGEVLAYDAQSFGGDARLWNPTMNTFTAVPNTQTNMFCTGLCALADGRLLVTGGHVNSAHVGVKDTNIFSRRPARGRRSPRWPTRAGIRTNTVLPDGRVLVTAGEIDAVAAALSFPRSTILRRTPGRA